MYCKYCGKEINEEANFCKQCGKNIDSNYAGFLLRLGAFLFDYILIFVFAVALGLFLGILGFSDIWLSNIPDTILGVAIIIIYHTFFLSIISSTPGKLAFGLKVANFEKEKVTFGKALIRSLSYILSSFFFGIGFWMIIFDKPRHQGLHDKIAKTLVLREKKRNLVLIISLFIVSLIFFVAIFYYTYSGI